MWTQKYGKSCIWATQAKETIDIKAWCEIKKMN